MKKIERITKMSKPFARLMEGMKKGRNWELMGDKDSIKELLWEVYEQRYNKSERYKSKFDVRANMQKKEKVASYAGWITSENPSSGGYQGTSFVWFPGESGSVAVLVIGTDGFGADVDILGRPGHSRRLRAIGRLHKNSIWIKPDILDLGTMVPESTSCNWPDIHAALSQYKHVIYAACEVRSQKDADTVADMLDFFFSEHEVPLKGSYKEVWETKKGKILGEIFPPIEVVKLKKLLDQRKYLILEGPPGTGKTRMALKIANDIGNSSMIQFHPARTYEDFIVGLYPKPTKQGLAFEVKAGDLLQANKEADKCGKEYLLVIDEINRADIAKVLGESILLFEPGEERKVILPHTPIGFAKEFSLSKNLKIIGTRNTADATIARMDLAIRRRFAFIEMWPDRNPVQKQGSLIALECFDDSIGTFVEYASDETLRLIPGQSYFLDPQPKGITKEKDSRITNRLKYELVPLLREYLAERICGGAHNEIAGLADRIEAKILNYSIK